MSRKTEKGRKARRQRDRGAGCSSSKQTCRHREKPAQGVSGPEGSEVPSWLHVGPCRDLRGKWGQIATEELKEIARSYRDESESVGCSVVSDSL